MENIKEIIKSYSYELGFNKVGFAQYQLLSEEIINYNKWLDANFQATMGWMERNVDKREDVSLILENSKTVIVFAFSYFTNRNHNLDLDGKGKISRYAWGSDYHEILLDKLELIENKIKKYYPESHSKSYVDTGPILEKQWAVKSGIGWQGKNSLILNKELGSYFFLGIIISDLEIYPDNEAFDYCSTCRKCIDACPTSAIIEDKLIDSNKCISYWTIEAKAPNEIPENISKNLNRWVYGCDICQEVCPWNKNKPKLTHEEKFFPKFDETIIDFSKLKKMDDSEFKLRYVDSPIKRTKLLGILRNIKAIENS